MVIKLDELSFPLVSCATRLEISVQSSQQISNPRDDRCLMLFVNVATFTYYVSTTVWAVLVPIVTKVLASVENGGLPRFLDERARLCRSRTA